MVATNFQHLTVNLAKAQVRRVILNGRPYLVAPASLIVPGVLNGSDGALYYPPDETSKTPHIWNQVPIVVYHPSVNGDPVSASYDHPSVVESRIGFLRNSTYVDKLGAEAWFDEELTKNYDRKLSYQFQIYPRLTKNEPIELSTGLFVDKDPTPGFCPRTGRPYDYIARNYRPDHLAVLPDQRGACSVADGCGVVVNTENCGGSGSGVPGPCPAGGGGNISTVKGLYEEASNLAGEIASREPSKKEFQTFQERAAKINDQAKATVSKMNDSEALKAAKEMGFKSEMTPEKARSSVAGRLRNLIGSAMRVNNENSPTSPKTLWQKLGKMIGVNTTNAVGKYGNPQHGDTGKFQKHGSGYGKGEQHAAAVLGASGLQTVQAAAEDGADASDDPVLDNDPDLSKMKLNDGTCPCGGTCDSCKETTNAEDEGQWVTLPNGTYIQVKDGEIVKGPKIDKKDEPDEFTMEVKDAPKNSPIPTTKTGKSSGMSSPVVPRRERDTGKDNLKYLTGRSKTRNQLGDHLADTQEADMALTAVERKAMVTGIVVNCKCQDNEVETLNKLTDATLIKLNAMPPQFMKGAARAAPDDEEEEEEEVIDNSPSKIYAKNQAGMTEKEWLASAPPMIRNAVTNAMKIERKAKEEVVTRLLNNADETKRVALSKFLSNKSLDELELMTEMLPPVQNITEIDQLFAPVYAGASGSREVRPVANEEEILPLPTTNWESQEGYKQEKSRREMA